MITIHPETTDSDQYDLTVNGHQLREALRRFDLLRSTASSQFNDSLYAFEEETKLSPVEVMEQFKNADNAYARIQEIQQWYNQNVQVKVGNEEFSLSLAVKLIGGAGRIEKMWRGTITKKEDRYGYDRSNIQRERDTEYASRTYSEKDCLAQVQKAVRFSSDLRSAIARANSISLRLPFTMTKQEYNSLFE
jgi:hypothetical protein